MTETKNDPISPDIKRIWYALQDLLLAPEDSSFRDYYLLGSAPRGLAMEALTKLDHQVVGLQAELREAESRIQALGGVTLDGTDHGEPDYEAPEVPEIGVIRARVFVRIARAALQSEHIPAAEVVGVVRGMMDVYLTEVEELIPVDEEEVEDDG